METFWVFRCAVVTLFSLQEIVAGHDYVNVALGKPTRQKDTLYQAYSRLAVDGNRNSRFIIGPDGTCTHTQTKTNAWWEVDLQRSYPIHSVAITNRNIMCNRLRDFIIYISTVKPVLENLIFTDNVCKSYNGMLPCSGPHTIPCDKIYTGRYVYLWKPHEKLTICEFEVMVEKKYVMDSRHEMFNIRHGWKSLMFPFYSESIGISSIIKCATLCMTRIASAGQLKQATGECECIQKSDLDNSNSDLPLTTAAGWILLEVTN